MPLSVWRAFDAAHRAQHAGSFKARTMTDRSRTLVQALYEADAQKTNRTPGATAAGAKQHRYQKRWVFIFSSTVVASRRPAVQDWPVDFINRPATCFWANTLIRTFLIFLLLFWYIFTFKESQMCMRLELLILWSLENHLFLWYLSVLVLWTGLVIGRPFTSSVLVDCGPLSSPSQFCVLFFTSVEFFRELLSTPQTSNCDFELLSLQQLHLSETEISGLESSLCCGWWWLIFWRTGVCVVGCSTNSSSTWCVLFSQTFGSKFLCSLAVFYFPFG